jgi:hypothetical protein
MEIFTPLLVASFGFLYAGSSAWRAMRHREQRRSMLHIAQLVAAQLALTIKRRRRGPLLCGEFGGRGIELTLYPSHVRGRTRFAERLLPQSALIRCKDGELAVRGLQALPIWLEETLRAQQRESRHPATADMTLQARELRVVQCGRLSVDTCLKACDQLLALALTLERARPEANLR